MTTTYALHVIKPGAHTCVQDMGRDGWRHIGVGRAGALDPAQAALATHLVGNSTDAAVLEIARIGPTLECVRPIRIALCGAEIDARFESSDGHRHIVPLGRAVTLPTGTLRLGAVRDGVRVWLAIAGGIDVPQVLGSRSTDLRGSFGGIEGRALRAGDVLPLGAHLVNENGQLQAPAWWVSLDDAASRREPIRYVPSSLAIAASLTDQEWRVDSHSDRQGLRCAGEPLVVDLPEQVSAPVAPGTIQLPPDGRPIVLLADAQTVGGYPRLGYAIAADMPRLGQLRAGDALHFEAVTAAEAQAAMQRRRNEIARLHWVIDLAHAQRTNA